MPPRIVVTNGPNRGLAIEVGATPITVGHHESRELPLKDDRVSRLHARIERRGEEIVLTDCGSTNGTFVNGATVRNAVLHSGDIIVMGKTSLQFEDRPTSSIPEPAEISERPTASLMSQDTTALLADTIVVDDEALKAHLMETVPSAGMKCDVVSVVRQAVADTEELAHQRRVTLKLDAPAELPAKADASLLYHVLRTILSCCLQKTSGRALRLTARYAVGVGIEVSLAADDPQALRTALKEVMEVGLIEEDVSALGKLGGNFIRQEEHSPGDVVVTLFLPEEETKA